MGMGWILALLVLILVAVPEIWRRAAPSVARRVEYVQLPAPPEGAFAEVYRETEGWALERGFAPGVAVELRLRLGGETARIARTAYWPHQDGRVVLSLLENRGRVFYDFDTAFEGVDLTTTNFPGHLSHPCVLNGGFRLQVFPEEGLDALHARHREAVVWLERTLRRPALEVAEVLPWIQAYQARRLKALRRCPFFFLRFWVWPLLRRRYLNRPVWEVSPR